MIAFLYDLLRPGAGMFCLAKDDDGPANPMLDEAPLKPCTDLDLFNGAGRPLVSSVLVILLSGVGLMLTGSPLTKYSSWIKYR